MKLLSAPDGRAASSISSGASDKLPPILSCRTMDHHEVYAPPSLSQGKHRRRTFFFGKRYVLCATSILAGTAMSAFPQCLVPSLLYRNGLIWLIGSICKFNVDGRLLYMGRDPRRM